MSRARTIAPLLLAIPAVVAGSAAAASGSSHAKRWQNKPESVQCGIKIQLPGKPANTILCSARGIPRPKHGGSVGDPFVQITAYGAAQLVLISQDSFEGGTPTTLATGATWSSLGVTCTIAAKTVTCKNESRHGFTIGNGKYKAF